MSRHAQRGEPREAQRLASELIALLDSIGDPALTAQAGFGAVGIKAQAGEMGEVLRWAEATIEWADGDPAKGNLVVGSPLALALALRGLARSWFGRPGWREDHDDAIAFAEQSADPLTLTVTTSWAFGSGTWNGVRRADDAAVRAIESALQTAEASGDNYAVVMAKWLLGSVLLLRGAGEDRYRGLELLAEFRDMWIQQRYLLSELPVLDVHLARDQARSGDRDGAIPVTPEIGGRHDYSGPGRLLHPGNRRSGRNTAGPRRRRRRGRSRGGDRQVGSHAGRRVGHP